MSPRDEPRNEPSEPPAPRRTVRTPPRHRVQRVKDRARYDREAVHAVLDAGLIAHVAFAIDSQPFVIPMLYAREGDTLLLHGSVASRLVTLLGRGAPASVGVTLVDALVLARSHFHHTLNYRSVVAFGTAAIIEDIGAKRAALERFVDAIIPGRGAESRAPDREELAATHVLRFAIEDASAKIRSGPPKDAPGDVALAAWAGVVPCTLRYGAPVADAHVPPAVPPPESVRRLLRNRETDT